jgi:hypothetical protein
MNRIIILTILLVIMANAGTRVYDIEPYKNVNAWSPQNGYIGETFTAICDSFVWVDIFIGAPDTAHNNNYYRIEILPSGSSNPVAWGNAPAGDSIQYRYTRAMLTQTDKIIKGKEYLLKVTQGNGDSINFYYSPEDPYKYGEIQVGGGVFHPPPQNLNLCDLAARIEGINKFDDDWWGTHLYITPMPYVWTQFGLNSGWGTWTDTAKSAGIKWTREAIEWGNLQLDLLGATHIS